MLKPAVVAAGLRVDDSAGRSVPHLGPPATDARVTTTGWLAGILTARATSTGPGGCAMRIALTASDEQIGGDAAARRPGQRIRAGRSGACIRAGRTRPAMIPTVWIAGGIRRGSRPASPAHPGAVPTGPSAADAAHLVIDDDHRTHPARRSPTRDGRGCWTLSASMKTAGSNGPDSVSRVQRSTKNLAGVQTGPL